MRALLFPAVLVASLLSGCFNGGHTRGRYRVGLLTPSCKPSGVLAKKLSAAESKANRKEWAAAWAKRRALDAEWTGALQALGRELGLSPAESDVPVVLEELKERAGALSANGCTAKVAATGKLGYELGCRKAEGESLRLRNEMTALVDRHVVKLLEMAESFEPMSLANRMAAHHSLNCPDPAEGRMDARIFSISLRGALQGEKYCSLAHQEPCLLACQFADAAACEVIASQYSVDGDMEASFRFGERACAIALEGGAASGFCARVVDWLLRPNTSHYDAKRGLALIDQLCANAASPQCSEVEERNLLVASTPHFSRERARRPLAKLDKECRANPDYHCAGVVRAYADAFGDVPRAVEIAEVACRVGANLCAQVALSFVPADPAQAASFARRACDADAKSCLTAAYVFLESNFTRAAEYAKRACEAEASYCGGAAQVLLGRDDATARAFAERACDADANSCFTLATFHEMGQAGLPKSKENALAVWQRMCDQTKNPAWCARAKQP